MDYGILKACTGNKFIKEINPMNMKGLTFDKVKRQIKRNYFAIISFSRIW